MMQHNFTDGMALGSAFLLHGSVGGWSRTLFLLAHELPQEVILIIRLNFTIVPTMVLMHSSLALLSGNVNFLTVFVMITVSWHYLTKLVYAKGLFRRYSMFM